jgi:Flp pilus assembly protein TadG
VQGRITHLYRDERGMSFVYVGVGFMGFLAASTLAIDVGMFMAARSQAQNAADAGALAGAVALVKNSYTDRSATGPVVQSAINTATANQVMGAAPTVFASDVTFPTDPDGQANRVQVQVYRTATHDPANSNAVPTLMGSIFGVATVDITATATAEASPANAMTCVKPFMIPDKWEEHQTGSWDPGDTFDKYTNRGELLSDPDIYRGVDPERNKTCVPRPAENKDQECTGYVSARPPDGEIGTVLVLRAGTGDQINPSFYYSWKMPGDTGGDFYRENIANCNQTLMRAGDKIIQEPGDKSGPTIQGIEDLIAKDPGAYWDTDCQCVKGSKFATSPRVFPIPMYDPDYYAEGKKNGRVADFRIANFLGFFVDRPPQGNSIHGIITDIVGTVDRTAGKAPVNAFPKAIRLVQ